MFSLPTFINAFGFNPEGERRSNRGAPIAGTLAILFTVFAILTGFFSVLGLTSFTELQNWLAYIIVLFGGLIFAPVMVKGFKFDFYQPIREELNIVNIFAIIIGGLSIVVIQLILSMVSKNIAFSTGNFEFVLLSPASETFGFSVILFMAFRLRFPEYSWAVSNLISSVSFAAFHYWRYGGYAEVLLIFAILFIGNSILNYIFEVTRQVLVPMLAHFVSNAISVWGQFVNLLQTAIPFIIFLGIIVIAIRIFLFRGRG